MSAPLFQPVGCDGELYSSKTVDRCGVCGGNGTSCQRISGSYRKALTQLGNTHTDNHIQHTCLTDTGRAFSDYFTHQTAQGNHCLCNHLSEIHYTVSCKRVVIETWNQGGWLHDVFTPFCWFFTRPPTSRPPTSTLLTSIKNYQIRCSWSQKERQDPGHLCFNSPHQNQSGEAFSIHFFLMLWFCLQGAGLFFFFNWSWTLMFSDLWGFFWTRECFSVS